MSYRFYFIAILFLSFCPTCFAASGVSSKPRCKDLYLSDIRLPDKVFEIPSNGTIEICAITYSSPPRVRLKVTGKTEIVDLSKTKDGLLAYLKQNYETNCGAHDQALSIRDLSFNFDEILKIKIEAVGRHCTGFTAGFPYTFFVALPLVVSKDKNGIGLKFGEPYVSPKTNFSKFFDWAARSEVVKQAKAATDSLNEKINKLAESYKNKFSVKISRAIFSGKKDEATLNFQAVVDLPAQQLKAQLIDYISGPGYLSVKK